jgi:hypothetical protein
MKIQRYFVFGLAWLSVAPYALSQPPGQDARALFAFRDALNQDGFDVNPGAAAVLNLVAGWCSGTPLPGFDHALYANNQPYLQLLIPKSAQEPGQLAGVFQLGPQEAVVLIGQTPPRARYFGFHAYLRTKVKPDGTMQSLWNSLGDAVNNATVKTTGPTPFNSPVALIFTPDQRIRRPSSCGPATRRVPRGDHQYGCFPRVDAEPWRGQQRGPAFHCDAQRDVAEPG